MTEWVTTPFFDTFPPRETDKHISEEFCIKIKIWASALRNGRVGPKDTANGGG